MFRHCLSVPRCTVLVAAIIAASPAAVVRGEIHPFCPILSGTTCGKLRARNASLVDQMARQVAGNAAALQTIRKVRAAAAADALKGADLVELAKVMRAAPPAAQTKIELALGEIAVNQQVQTWLRGGRDGATNFARKVNNVPIALVPGIPRGRIVPMGFGPVIIGVGDNRGDLIALGEGNVDLVAAEVSGATTANVEVLLANPTDTAVSYTVNQRTFSMQPTFKQTLSGGSIVAFDRGNGNGTARYQLTGGYYEFELTPKGWELSKKQRPAPAVTEVAATSPPAPEPSAYAQAVSPRLPKDFKLFDPVPVISGGEAAPTAAKLPEHFTLFRAAAEKASPSHPAGG